MSSSDLDAANSLMIVEMKQGSVVPLMDKVTAIRGDEEKIVGPLTDDEYLVLTALLNLGMRTTVTACEMETEEG